MNKGGNQTMATYLETFLFKVINGWLDTHPTGQACNEAIAKKLAQRIETRLARAGMITKDASKEKITERI